MGAINGVGQVYPYINLGLSYYDLYTEFPNVRQNKPPAKYDFKPITFLNII